MATPDIRYGVIDSEGLTLMSRVIDSVTNNLSDAFEEAADMIQNGTNRVSIVRCRFSERTGEWHEILKYGAITVDAGYWNDEDEE